jgi:DNA (cytosine-5)-methyltransferase 1
MRVLDLFSGIGGFSLGLERAGMRTVQFVELDPFCRAVLAKHWPDVPCHDDIRTFHAPAGFADVICGGFPCQDLSFAGEGAGLAGERSGLWSEYARLIGEVRPRYAIVENVSALLARGLGDVLRDLAEIGYNAEWHCIPAAAVGAPHRRDRVWVVCYPYGDGESACAVHDEVGWLARAIADAAPVQWPPKLWSEPDGDRQRTAILADTDSPGRDEPSSTRDARAGQSLLSGQADGRFWESEPDVGRVAHGVSARVDRLRSLGNSVVPQIPEIIGRAIMRAENGMR